MSDWTTMRIRTEDLDALKRLRRQLEAEADRDIPLHDLAGDAVTLLLRSHGMNGRAPIISQSPALVNEQ